MVSTMEDVSMHAVLSIVLVQKNFFHGPNTGYIVFRTLFMIIILRYNFKKVYEARDGRDLLS